MKMRNEVMGGIKREMRLDLSGSKREKTDLYPS